MSEFLRFVVKNNSWLMVKNYKDSHIPLRVILETVTCTINVEIALSYEINDHSKEATSNLSWLVVKSH